MELSMATVLGVLQTAGFVQLPKPLVVADSSFDFDAAVVGTGVSHDLVVVASTETSRTKLVRLLSSLGRTLDQVESRRPVTLALLGEDTGRSTTAALERHARVLEITGLNPHVADVRRALAILMPLSLPSATVRGRDPLTQVTEILGGSLSDEQRELIAAARVGPDEVRTRLRWFIDGVSDGDEGVPIS